mmetsp:Transcript_29349/g.113695  ORF Transcript_29349/g.113695 Transcript_29349/m.113695 type:complete len:222 (-) Transcript_29349:756-1421(-)|eukprot:CAMPEP_0113964840 /NCGR_PEP_ID=MMETSP0011_2-20120614/7388_1 /TAXON_ID=101924 /ORGANISM="Rhodosorus marinus" /LENGTH=221 /DNA_ID=CAMNT_0000977237 /DNA_START=101 /DNA_END=766 /DNA_ORIENTATION=- /assembly_acc=CAM_ASM_000156
MGLFGKKSEPPPPQPKPAKAPDMFETIFNMKFTAKQLGKLAKKSEKSIKDEKLKCKLAIEKGNVESAKVHAENAVRNEKQAVSYLRLQSRIEAVASKLEAHSQMVQVTSSMGAVTESLNAVLGTTDITKITEVMDTFEKQFEDLDLQAAYMDDAIGDSVAGATPQSEVNKLMQQVAEEHNLEVKSEFLGGAVPLTSQAAASQAKPVEDPLEERMRALQKDF